MGDPSTRLNPVVCDDPVLVGFAEDALLPYLAVPFARDGRNASVIASNRPLGPPSSDVSSFCLLSGRRAGREFLLSPGMADSLELDGSSDFESISNAELLVRFPGAVRRVFFAAGLAGSGLLALDSLRNVVPTISARFERSSSSSSLLLLLMGSAS